MPKEHTFDIVSQVDLQELHNALSQAQKEIRTRFDFKGSSASITFEETPPTVKLAADQSMQLKSVMDLLETKMVKRGVPINGLAWESPEELPSGGVKQQGQLQQGLTSEKAREIVKEIKGLGMKVQPRIDGDSIRVSAKQIDDLQTVMKTLQEKDFGVPIQFDNYR